VQRAKPGPWRSGLSGEYQADRERHERATSELAATLGRLVREVATDDASDTRDDVARFILGCVLAMFVEHTDLLPSGFTPAIAQADRTGDMHTVWALLDELGSRLPGARAPAARPPLSRGQIHTLHLAARDFPWKNIHPEVFGSIFEKAIDPRQRHELGAHFTREADIARVVGPTVVAPWQARIAGVRTPADADDLIAQMRSFHVLDPACGCGNFLYVVYREMKRLERALASKRHELHPAPLPPPGPWFTLVQLHGIELNSLAASLARVVLWIGEHLANRELGREATSLPLTNLDHTIRHDDALIIDWPRPEGELAIVGNPPYLGVRKLRRELGDTRVDALFARHPNNRAADYATYWFTRALEVLRPGERAGYVCTNSIAQNESRAASIDLVLAAGGAITDAWRSYPWPGEAAVHVGIVNWVMAPWPGPRTLAGKQVRSISPGLTDAVDVTTARHLPQNEGRCFMGMTPGNDGFVLNADQRAEILLKDPGSSVVIRPYLIGRDINRAVDQQPSRWVIDFGLLPEAAARRFPGAFEHIQRTVFAAKHSGSDRKTGAEKTRWWQFVRPRPELRAALAPLDTVLVVSRISPHLIVSRQPANICLDGALIVFIDSAPHHFGVLQSRIHATWAWARGSTLESRLRYTNTTIFATFPFPTSASPAQIDAIARAADAFERLRSATCKQRGLGLTKLHNELETGAPSPLRHALDALNNAVSASYAFKNNGVWRDEHETLRLLLELNHRVSAAREPVAPSGIADATTYPHRGPRRKVIHLISCNGEDSVPSWMYWRIDIPTRPVSCMWGASDPICGHADSTGHQRHNPKVTSAIDDRLHKVTSNEPPVNFEAVLSPAASPDCGLATARG